MINSKRAVIKILNRADIKINGDRDWDIQIHNDKFYSRILGGGSLALGESYMDEWWDCKRIDILIEKLLSISISENKNLNVILLALKSKFTNMQSKLKAFQVGEEHYDLDNNLYKKMLDKRMIYSCGYWRKARNLDEAQEQKLDLICRKLQLKKGMRVLDIGCGWGGFAKFAAQNYGVSVVGLTISKEQAKLAKENCKSLNVEIKVQDYRLEDNLYDRILSIGMFEHVGYKNYREYINVVNKCLKNEGLTLIHTIGQNVSSTKGNAWSNKYIFPNGMLPSVKQIGSAIEGIFVLEDWHNFGIDYYRTLHEWDKNFVKNWPELKNNYNERFYRMWRYYLMSFAGSFKSRHIQLWQIVLSKGDIKETYNRLK